MSRTYISQSSARFVPPTVLRVSRMNRTRGATPLLPLLLVVVVVGCGWRLPLAASFAAVVPHLGRSQPVPRSIRRTTTTGNDDDDELRVVGYTTTTTTGNNNNNSNNNNIGLYVHIPFCRRRCRYCDFAIVPIGTTNNTTQAHAGGSSTSSSTLFDVYTHAIIQEIESLGSSSADQQQVTLTSIYLGGGTPSLAPLAMLQAIVQAIRRTFRVALDDDDVEFTMEMDPGTFDQRALEGYQRLGVNRISLGVQSFDNDVLAYLGRQHRLDDIQESLRLLRQVYGSSETTCNYSLDLIASLPGVSPAAWCDTLSQAMRLDPKPSHVSVYDLTIEAGTVFGRWYDNTNNGDKEDIPTTTNKTTRRLPSSTESAFQYQYTAGYLAARGYEHYEISSYAVPGRRSRHNQLYWGYESTWYAVGLGATSYQPAQGGLVARPRAMADYVAWVAEARPAALSQAESTESLLQDLVMKRLRTKEGIDIDHVRDKFGPRYGDAILEGSYLDLDGLAVHEPPSLRLVDSKGFLFSNSIISNIFLAIEGVE